MTATARYRQLDAGEIVATIARLRDRIEERFPGAGLGRVSGELLSLARETTALADYLRRPHWPIRAAVAVTIALMVAVIIAIVSLIPRPSGAVGLTDFVQAMESTINDVIFFGIALFFLLTLESRIKRRRALAALHELRSLVHIVDMHQLTKDPEYHLSGQTRTASSPVRSMSAPQLGRYLDYCSELLSLSSKVAALFVQHFNDPVVLAGVTEIESLAGSLSGKIWQKITLLKPAESQRL
jgi:hypothetical protein